MADDSSHVTRVQYPLSADTYQILQDAQFLYRLLNAPEGALQAEESILSIMKSSSLASNTVRARDKDSHEDSSKHAYWDHMKQALSGDDPKEHIDELKHLYTDLSQATSRFFPPRHPLYALFKCPLAPTTHPLDMVAHNMRQLSAGLRERCAPIRDNALMAVQQTLRITSPLSITKAAQDIIEVAKLMGADLNDYMLQNASEEDAKEWVKAQARSKEREVALPIAGTQEKLVQAWKDYLQVGTARVSRTHLTRRILQTISSSAPALFLPPDARNSDTLDQNLVPLQLMLRVDALVKAQDLAQAIVVVASLHNLIPVAPPSTSSFVSRLWALVESAISESGSSTEPPLRLIDIQDEVVEAYRTSYTAQNSPRPLIPDDTLRATVLRTLRTEDPVFKLLQKRLFSALEVELAQPTVANVAPVVMKTGREQGANRSGPSSPTAQLVRVKAKGFEYTVLDEPIQELLQSIKRIVEQVVFSWDDYVSGES